MILIQIGVLLASKTHRLPALCAEQGRDFADLTIGHIDGMVLDPDDTQREGATLVGARKQIRDGLGAYAGAGRGSTLSSQGSAAIIETRASRGSWTPSRKSPPRFCRKRGRSDGCGRPCAHEETPSYRSED